MNKLAPGRSSIAVVFVMTVTMRKQSALRLLSCQTRLAVLVTFSRGENSSRLQRSGKSRQGGRNNMPPA